MIKRPACVKIPKNESPECIYTPIYTDLISPRPSSNCDLQSEMMPSSNNFYSRPSNSLIPAAAGSASMLPTCVADVNTVNRTHQDQNRNLTPQTLENLPTSSSFIEVL